MERQTTKTAGRVNDLVDDLEEAKERVIEKWDQVVEAIQRTTEDASAAGPRFDLSSPLVFQTYWRTVFTRLRQSVSADPDIPRHLTAPPVTKFTVTLFNGLPGRLNCPCCHPDVAPNIVLENKDGVTKEDFMDGFISCMYGDSLPRVYAEPGPLRSGGDEEPEAPVEEAEDPDGFRDDAGALIYSANWMSDPGAKDGEIEIYGTVPNIMFYCCRENEYAERIADMEMKEREAEEWAAKRIEDSKTEGPGRPLPSLEV